MAKDGRAGEGQAALRRERMEDIPNFRFLLRLRVIFRSILSLEFCHWGYLEGQTGILPRLNHIRLIHG